jgi:dihydrodipicolinate synthase/N-acetylneuraminate lyase
MKDLKSKLKNSLIPAMGTPLTGDLGLNHHALEKLINFLIEAGVGGLFVGGTTGEGILMSLAQRMELHEIVFEVVNRRIPVLVHVGTNTTSETISLSMHAASMGVDAIVAVAPYYYPIHDQAQVEYYSTIADASKGIPLFAYDIPQMAINGLNPELIQALQDTIPSFSGFKTSRPDAQVVRQLIDAAGDELVVLVGNERIALGTLALGADGLISGLSTAIPEPFVAMTRAFASGDYDLAREYQKKINLLTDLLPAGARIGAIKQILTERGIDAGPAVPPRPMPPDDWPGWSQMREIIE